MPDASARVRRAIISLAGVAEPGQPRTLAPCGKGDPRFTVQGAYALKRDVPRRAW